MKVQETDFETVEKKVEYTQCDVPGCFHDDKETELVELAVNPTYECKESIEPQIIKTFEDESEALMWKNNEERKMINPCPSFEENIKYGGGYSRERYTRNAISDAQFHVCVNCLKNHFEVVPDDYEPENINNVESNGRGLILTEEKTYLLPFDGFVWGMVADFICILIVYGILIV